MIANDGLWQGVRLLTSESIQFLQQVAAPPNDGGRQGRAFFYYGGHNLLGHGGGELGKGLLLDLLMHVFASLRLGIELLSKCCVTVLCWQASQQKLI